MSIETLYNTTANVYTVTLTQDTIGGVVKTNSTNPSISSMPCRIRDLAGGERQPIVGREGESTTHRLYCGASNSINITDRITISSLTYEVIGVANPHGMNRFQQIDLLLLT